MVCTHPEFVGQGVGRTLTREFGFKRGGYVDAVVMGRIRS